MFCCQKSGTPRSPTSAWPKHRAGCATAIGRFLSGTMHLTDGGSERVVVPVHAESDQIHAATDGERILIFTGHHCVLIGSGGEYRIAEAESESMAFGCFSADGRYFARAGISSYSSGSEVMGQGVTVIRTEGLPADRETVYSAEAYGLSGLDVNDEGMALAFAIVFFPDAAGFPERQPFQQTEKFCLMETVRLFSTPAAISG